MDSVPKLPPLSPPPPMEDFSEPDRPLTPAGRLFVQPLMDQVINSTMAVQFPFDVDAIKSAIRSSIMVRHPRFCSLLVTDSSGREHWRRTSVDIDRHVIVRRNRLCDDPSVSDEDAVNELVADLTVSSPLPTDKPLWEIHLLLAHNTAVIRLHHALGDGISLMAALLSFCRQLDDPSKSPSIGVGVSDSAPPKKKRSVWTMLLVIWYTLIYAVEFLLRTLWLKDDTTAVSGGAGVELWPRKLATARFRLDDMKIVKRAVADATINDVLLGVITRGLSKYLDMKSSKDLAEGVRLTGLSMVNLRPHPGLQDILELMSSKTQTQWGNKFGMLLLPIYYHKIDSDPIQSVKRAKQMVDKKKLSLEAPFSYGIGKLTMSLCGAKIASILNYRIVCNTTFTLSNIIGPREEISVVGNPIKYLRVTSSGLPHAITMHMLSYAGNADMQILVAKDVIPDPKVLARCFENVLLEMKEVALKGNS